MVLFLPPTLCECCHCFLSGHVNRANRPNTWRHRPSLQREERHNDWAVVLVLHQARARDGLGRKLGFDGPSGVASTRRRNHVRPIERPGKRDVETRASKRLMRLGGARKEEITGVLFVRPLAAPGHQRAARHCSSISTKALPTACSRNTGMFCRMKRPKRSREVVCRCSGPRFPSERSQSLSSWFSALNPKDRPKPNAQWQDGMSAVGCWHST